MIDPKQIENALAMNEARKEAIKKAAEEKAKWIKEAKDAARIVFSTKTGIIFGRALMRLSGIYNKNKNSSNLYEIGKERGKEELYLELVKGLLSDDIVSQIERKGVK